MSGEEIYSHVGLQTSRSIRVLELEPAVQHSATINCTLKEISLDEDPLPIYYALSYCWESKLRDTAIYCGDGKVLKITRNCYTALTRLRAPHGIVPLWVDSICIDQSNVAEQNRQVALMGEMYKRAAHVVVWLGEWDDALRKAVSIIKSLGTPPGEGQEEGRRLLRAKAEAFKKETLSVAVDPFLPLTQRSWFHRMWTLQEVSLAREGNVVFYGGPERNDQVDWLTIILANDALQAVRYPRHGLRQTLNLQKYLTMEIMMKRNPELRAKIDAKPGDFLRSKVLVWQIIVQTRHKGATVVKDRVFALFGILNELEVSIPLPDYNKSIEDVFRELTIACINADKFLHVLCEVASDRRHLRPRLASWVPDLSDPGWGPGWAPDFRQALTRERFCAAGPSDARWKFSSDGMQLILSGKVLDGIIYCGSALNFWKDENLQSPLLINPEAFRLPAFDGLDHVNEQVDKMSRIHMEAFEVFRSWIEISKWNASYPTGESTAQAFCRTLVKDRPEMTQGRRDFDEWYEMLSKSDAEIIETFARRNEIRALHTLLPPGVSEELFIIMAAKSVGAIAMSRTSYFYSSLVSSDRHTFFITEDGYMGLAPALDRGDMVENLVMAGDRIVVVAGLDVPLILRPVNPGSEQGPFRLVTHTFVHGIMYGEAWEDDCRSEQDIVLV